MNSKIELNSSFYEFCIYAEKSFLPYYNLICNQMQNCQCSDQKPNFFSTTTDEGFVFAIDYDKKELLTKALKNNICNYFVETKKAEFFKSELKGILIDEQLKNIFIKILTLFDDEQDKLEIQKNLRLDGKLYLDGLYHFKLKTLKGKWQEIAQMTIDNALFFSSNNFVFELFRFLLSNIKPKTDMLFVRYQSNQKHDVQKQNKQDNSEETICLTDDNDKVIFSKSKHSFKADEFVIKILDNYPARLYYKPAQNILQINTENKSDNTENDLFSMLNLIFKKNLKILQWFFLKRLTKQLQYVIINPFKSRRSTSHQSAIARLGHTI